MNADLMQTCDDLASRGFLADWPNLFWCQRPGVDLGGTSEVEWRHGLSLYSAYNRGLGVHDVLETDRAAARLDGTTGNVVLLGYCLGGLMVFLAAARGNADRFAYRFIRL